MFGLVFAKFGGIQTIADRENDILDVIHVILGVIHMIAGQFLGVPPQLTLPFRRISSPRSANKVG